MCKLCQVVKILYIFLLRLTSGVLPFSTQATFHYWFRPNDSFHESFFDFLFFITTLVLSPWVLPAQTMPDSTIRPFRLNISLQGGMSTYQGDLIPVELSLKGAGPSIAWGISRNVSPRLFVGLEACLATYAGSDFDFNRMQRGLSSTAAVIAAGVNVRWFPKPLLRPRKGWNSQPYALAATGALYSESSVAGLPAQHPDAQVLHVSSWYAGGGFGYQFYNWEGWMFGIEARRFLTGTDYLDGISAAGNPKRNDGLSMLLVRVGKYF
jgi:hypothetical protein